MRHVHSLRGEPIAHSLAALVGSDPGDQPGSAPQPDYRYGLIGALPAQSLLKDFPLQGLSRNGETLALDEIVRVHAAYDDDIGPVLHGFELSPRAT